MNMHRLPPAYAVGTSRPAPAGWRSSVLAPSLAATLAVSATVVGWRGTDLAAQVFRANLFKRYGFVLWNPQWFGGHATLSYSVLTPLVSAMVGPVAVATLSGVAGALVFDRIVRRQFGDISRAGSLWFAVGTAANVVIGRVPFALGLAFGLVVILALQRGLVVAAIPAAMLTTLASPVAGVFAALAVFAWALSARGRWFAGIAVAAAVLLPLATVTLLFPDGGVFPYEPWAFALDVALAAVFFYVVRAEHLALRIGAVLYALMATLVFVVPSALGGNFSRFSQFFAGPILACVLWPRRKVSLALLTVPLLCWQWVPALQTIASGQRVPESSQSYYLPLVDYVLAQGVVPGRMEIPLTSSHWESAYVAGSVPLARGWERQLDLTYNHIFYDGTLDAATFEAWLTDNAVQFVALPDAPLDDSSVGERRLLETGLPYLEPAWRDAHWQVWRFGGYRGLVEGLATVVGPDATGFRLRVDAPGDVTLRVRPSPHWKLGGAGCVAASDDGWIRLEGLHVGTVAITQQWQGTPCS
jgi:hypothetical protein